MSHTIDNDELDLGHACVPIVTICMLSGIERLIVLTAQEYIAVRLYRFKVPRFVDDPKTEDTGQGEPPLVDMGAYEFQSGRCVADLDDDGQVGFDDLVRLLDAWGACAGDCRADLDGDGVVGFNDLTVLLAAWGPCE